MARETAGDGRGKINGGWGSPDCREVEWLLQLTKSGILKGARRQPLAKTERSRDQIDGSGLGNATRAAVSAPITYVFITTAG